VKLFRFLSRKKEGPAPNVIIMSGDQPPDVMLTMKTPTPEQVAALRVAWEAAWVGAREPCQDCLRVAKIIENTKARRERRKQEKINAPSGD
jgi:hypothetical protein